MPKKKLNTPTIPNTSKMLLKLCEAVELELDEHADQLIDSVGGLGDWLHDERADLVAVQQALRQKALKKLTAEEREALGF